MRQVEILQPDTAIVPNSGPTVASRTDHDRRETGGDRGTVGSKQSLLASGFLKERYTLEEFRHACERYIDGIGALQSLAKYQPPPDVFWDDVKLSGRCLWRLCWAVYVAEVSVDHATEEVRVDDFVAVQEVGKAIHPVARRGPDRRRRGAGHRLRAL